jgi:hypothetical protein
MVITTTSARELSAEDAIADVLERLGEINALVQRWDSQGKGAHMATHPRADGPNWSQCSLPPFLRRSHVVLAMGHARRCD